LLRQQKSLVALSRDPIFIWDFDGGIVEWNRGCEELYGFSREEALGQLKEHLLSTLTIIFAQQAAPEDMTGMKLLIRQTSGNRQEFEAETGL
jgi:PAS domain S-box-containing protein